MAKRKTGRRRRGPKESLQTKPEIREKIDKSKRIMLISGGIALASAICLKSDSRKPKKVLNEPLPLDRGPRPPQVATSSKDKIFEIPKPGAPIPREELGKRMKEVIGDKAKIVMEPEKFDPSKPILFIIGDTHVKGPYHQKRLENAYAVQREVVSLFHSLYPVGIKRLYLEGILEKYELLHDETHDAINENPVDALPEYKRTGKINRSYVAIEGIYGDRVQSIGAEDDSVLEFLQLKEERKKSGFLFGKILFQNTRKLYELVGLEFDSALAKSRQDVKEIRDKFKKHIQDHPEIDAHALAQETLLRDPDFLKRLDLEARYFFARNPKRDANYIKRINGDKDQKGDAVFIVGRHHAEQVAKKIEGYNVYVLLTPSMLERDEMPYWLDFTLEDYKKDITAYYMWQLGLTPEPANYLYAKNSF